MSSINYMSNDIRFYQIEEMLTTMFDNDVDFRMYLYCLNRYKIIKESVTYYGLEDRSKESFILEFINYSSDELFDYFINLYKKYHNPTYYTVMNHTVGIGIRMLVNYETISMLKLIGFDVLIEDIRLRILKRNGLFI